MIFVTVGTHEQGLDRLLIEMDNLIDKGIIKEEVFAQIGYCSYKPKNYNYKKMIGYDEMDQWVKSARIVITHGGPGSIFHPLQYKKIPVVVPRNPQLNEHVDNHQLLFVKRLEKNKRVLGIYDIQSLGRTIERYNELVLECGEHKSNSTEFIYKFERLINNRLKLRS